MYSLFLLSLLPAAALAGTVKERQSGPTVTIKNGTVAGSSARGVDSFRGIPYAQPPVGDLRLRPPQPITSTYGTIQATTTAHACPQFNAQIDPSTIPPQLAGLLANSPLFHNISDQSEDCLTIDVQRPSTASNSSKLPVLFWIYGGGFEFGATQQYDGSAIVGHSLSLGQPIIFVQVNYRVGGFGFLAGKELAQEHSTNLGLRDQRLGLQWVQDNIAAFGGDPSKVTIWGESAGSISVFDQTIINGGDNTYNGKKLFRGAIMSSGSITPANDVKTPRAQAVFDQVVQQTGCNTSYDKLACLRSKDFTTFQNAANSVPGFTSGVLSYLPRPDAGDRFFSQSPELSVFSNRFSKVPVIITDQEDEGTIFSIGSRNVTNNTQLVAYLADNYSENPNSAANVRAFASFYPDEILAGQPDGSPFRTGSLNNIYPEFKRLAAILGDMRFNLMRRVYLSIVASQVNSWSAIASYLYGTPVLGTFHASDIRFSFQPAPTNQTATDTIQTYLINFVNVLNPNGASGSTPLYQWPQYSTRNPQLLDIGLLNNTLIPDTFRQQAYKYLRYVATPQGQFRA